MCKTRRVLTQEAGGEHSWITDPSHQEDRSKGAMD